jgi:hypothetical protein
MSLTEKMSLEEAYRLLGISEESDLDAVTRAYRELSKKHHPDVPGGDDDKQTEINQAYQLLEASFKGGQLVPVEIRRAVEIVERGVAAQRAANQLNDLAAKLKRRRSRVWQQLKYMALVSAGLAGALGWFGDDLFKASFGDAANLQLQIFALILAGFAGLLQFIVQYQSTSVDSFIYDLTDESFCAEILVEQLIGNGSDSLPRDAFSYDDLAGPPDQRRVGSAFHLVLGAPEERLRLVLLKGIEHGMIEEVSKIPRRYKITEEFRPFVDDIFAETMRRREKYLDAQKWK